jgi:Putative FMN-binding domain
MKRRDLLAAIALASVGAKAQTPAEAAAAAESLYIPKPQLVDDRRFLHDFMDEFAFVDLVTVAPILRITHIPVWLDRAAGPYGTLHGHIAPESGEGHLRRQAKWRHRFSRAARIHLANLGEPREENGRGKDTTFSARFHGQFL